MKWHTEYHWFNIKQKREFINITDLVENAVKTAGIKEGMVPDGNLFNIGVGSVNRGKVVLAGRSNDPAEIEAAVKAASKARGVTEVISQVKQESGEDALTPEEIFHSQVNNDEE
jgi:osmotically-inducible protein OsmY